MQWLLIAYVDKTTEMTYYMVFFNALFVQSMNHHLVPPFLMREAGLIVDELPKIQSHNPESTNHTIYDPKSELRIHLQLNGIFSCFDVRALSSDEMKSFDEETLIIATPMGSKWNPYNPVYAEEEAGFLDAEGKFRDDRMTMTRKYHLMDDDEREGPAREIHHVWADPMSSEQYDELIHNNFEAGDQLYLVK